jgi:hypothetical protein
MKLASFLGCVLLAAVAPPVGAQVAQTYLYDSQGRVIAATTARPATNGVMAYYVLDDADNRMAHGALAVSPPPTADKLTWPYTLLPSQRLTSPNGLYHLTLETSGDLVLTGPSGMVWHSCTAWGRTMFSRVSSTGRLVLYDPQALTIWTTSNSSSAGAELILQNDGTAVLKSSGGATLWSSTTQCQ